MAIRYYFPDNTAPTVYPPLQDYPYDFLDWANATVHSLVSVKESTSFTTVTDAQKPAGSATLFRRYVIALGAQTIAGTTTVKAQIRASQENVGTGFDPFATVSIWAADGSEVLASVYAGYGSEAGTSLINRSIIPEDTIYDEVVVENGQLLVVDIGGTWSYSGYTDDGSLEFGDNSASDLPEDEVSTDQYCSWIEFSQTLTEATAFVSSGGFWF
jgi:hypothetical protein